MFCPAAQQQRPTILPGGTRRRRALARRRRAPTGSDQSHEDKILWGCVVDLSPEVVSWTLFLEKSLFSKKKALKSEDFIGGGFVIEMKLRSNYSTEQNIPNKIVWITWKTKQNLEIWPFLKSDIEKSLRESGQKLVLLPACGP